MSYEYTDSVGDKLRINSNGYGGATLVAEGKHALPRKTILIEREDVPTVAAELLKAAGQDYLAGYIEAVMEQEAGAAEKKLQERRNALGREFAEGVMSARVDYAVMPTTQRRAIDRIIELEDKLAGA